MSVSFKKVMVTSVRLRKPDMKTLTYLLAITEKVRKLSTFRSTKEVGALVSETRSSKVRPMTPSKPTK